MIINKKQLNYKLKNEYKKISLKNFKRYIKLNYKKLRLEREINLYFLF